MLARHISQIFKVVYAKLQAHPPSKETFNALELIMKDMRRVRCIQNGPRIIDLDILLYDYDNEINE